MKTTLKYVSKKVKVYFLRISILYGRTGLDYIRDLFLRCSEENE